MIQFQYSSGVDKFWITVGSIFAIAIGAGLPALMIFMGKLTDTFVEYEIYNQLSKLPNISSLHFNQTTADHVIRKEFYHKVMNLSSDMPTVFVRLKLDNETFIDKLNAIFGGEKWFEDDFLRGANKWSYSMIGVGVAFLVCGYVMVATMSAAANNQTQRIRINFFRAILKQDITWFDTKTSGDFATKVTAYAIIINLIKYNFYLTLFIKVILIRYRMVLAIK